MSDTVKVIIEISKDIYEARQRWVDNPKRMVDEVDIAIANGTPLDDVKAEIKENIATRESNKSMVQNIGLYMALEILDNIGKAESEA